MGLKIKNVKLDKEKYVYWIDKNINLSFELYSDKNETIKEIDICYWYDFFWNNQKHNAFQDKIVEENKIISEWIPEKFSFTIPIRFFNFWAIKIINYINIIIKNSLFSLKIKEELLPNIIFDEKSYNFTNFSLFDNKRKILFSEEDKNCTSWDYMSNKLKIANKIKENSEDFILIKRQFKGLFYWSESSIAESDKNSGDYIHKNIYNKLKEDIIVNIFDKLVNSKIYHFIYKYMYILFIFDIINVYTNNNIFNFSVDYLGYYYSILMSFFNILLPISFILFSKLLEMIFNSRIDNSFYDIEENKTEDIGNNIEHNLLNWNLKLTDIFNKFNLKIKDSSIEYTFSLFLILNVGTYYRNWNSYPSVYWSVYNIELFNYVWKGYFDLSKINLLENNYNKLSGILPESNTKPEAKVYYTLAYKCKSKHIPDMDGEMDLYLNFNK